MKMSDLLYRWPAAAELGRRVPKEKLYARDAVTPAIRKEFISQVARITWSHKLAESTINLPRSPEVPEIQIFQIEAKKEDISEQILSAIDASIPFPLIFEILRVDDGDQGIRMVAAHKVVGRGKPQISDYFTTGWLSASAERHELPSAMSLGSLYTALLAPLIPVNVRPGEDASDISARLEVVRSLQREISTLQRKLRTEPQLNRKIELHRALKKKKKDLERYS